MSTSAASSSANVINSADIYNSFVAVCAKCHQDSVGGFQVPPFSQFKTVVTKEVVQHITSAVCLQGTSTPSLAGEPNDPMPPCSSTNGGTYADRPETDSIKQLGEVLTEWIVAGQPQSFTPSGSSSIDGGSAGDAGPAPSPYPLTSAVGNAMTNIGNCIPTILASAEDPKSAALDEMFANLAADPSGQTGAQQIGLPELLSETDLVSLDSSVLANYRVLAYAPGYPLWSDNAGKLRHVRVPYGTSIHFDKASQKFEIPPNTRFYKTFMKQIIDTDGSYRYRKIETRLILSRPDVNNSDGTAKAQTALFGSYRWCAAGTEVACPSGQPDESEAYLVQTPLNSGVPFGDTLFLYNTDENLAADIRKGQPADLEYQLLTNNPPAARNYAIPSSQRCVQCHMGSPSESFILGFTPLQINRRPTGSGGVIPETGVGGVLVDTGPDELTQLQRFIDTGIITGIDSLSDVLPLEQSQGTRTPRNNEELMAQGYMLGNCQHCHNPRGFPSVQNSALKDLLDVLPGPTGGIFQFPLERYSPSIGRGVTGTTPIPFITPSLVDEPRANTTPADYSSFGKPGPDIFVHSGPGGPPQWVVYGPWRSLIYRAVDTAFAYTDDLALFPHMPFNTPGYDPRAKQILGDWMVSIPAVRKHPELVEYAYQVDSVAIDNIGSPLVDSTPQPYAELTPGAPGYDEALAAATERLEIFHSGENPALPIATSDGVIYSRYSDPGDTTDIIDPLTTVDPTCHPIPTAQASVPYPFPNHPDWVITDLSQPSGPWSPRGSSWPQVLVQQEIPPPNNTCSSVGQADAYADQVLAVGLLPNATLDQVRGYATTKVPFGLWQEQAGCTFPSSVPLAESFSGADRPHWMTTTAPASTAPVYMETPGAAVFKMICINCHGPKADSNGRLAANLATMTGGQAQVADFRDGLFGPVSDPEGNINRVFGTGGLPSGLSASVAAQWTGTPADPITADDRAARYMPWMALGGTTINIPTPILTIVAATSVLGVQRYVPASQLSANMLSQAKALCEGLLGPSTATALASAGFLDSPGLTGRLLLQNGDAELWLRLCATSNPPAVHVVKPSARVTEELDVVAAYNTQGNLDIGGTFAPALVDPTLYPVGVPIGNELGGIDATLEAPTASSKGNLWPWCVDDTSATPAQKTWIQSNNYPICPCNVKLMGGAGCQAGLGTPDVSSCVPSVPVGACYDTAAGNTWAVRGAINAGMSVFLYVRSIETSGPAPDYDQCTLLK